MEAMTTDLEARVFQSNCFPSDFIDGEIKPLIDHGETSNAMRGLLDKCLRLIDQNADRILLQEAIEDMDEDGLREIVKRDTLRVASEYHVFLALDRWTNRECKRRKLALNARNRRRVLGDLFYEIRFPYLKPEELLRKPIQTGLLSENELKMVSALISKSKNLPEIPEDWLPHMEKIGRKRSHSGSENLALSQRTYLIDLNKNKRELRRSYSFFRKKKKKDCPVENGNSNFRSMSIDSCRSDRKCMTRLAEYFLDIFVCLFDWLLLRSNLYFFATSFRRNCTQVIRWNRVIYYSKLIQIIFACKKFANPLSKWLDLYVPLYHDLLNLRKISFSPLTTSVSNRRYYICEAILTLPFLTHSIIIQFQWLLLYL